MTRDQTTPLVLGGTVPLVWVEVTNLSRLGRLHGALSGLLLGVVAVDPPADPTCCKMRTRVLLPESLRDLFPADVEPFRSFQNVSTSTLKADAEKLATGEVLALVTDAVLNVSEAMGKI
jgi:hypothetical protein